jgi:heme exporter protein A
MQTQRAQMSWNIPQVRHVAAADSVLQLEALAFDGEGGRQFQGISLRLNSGAVAWVFGGRPGDRSHFIRTVCGLHAPRAGELLWKGVSLLHSPRLMAAELVYLDRRNAVKQTLTPREHLLFHLRLRDCCPRLDIDSALQELCLQEFADVECGQLSASARRRVAIARLLITRSTILVLDDPMLDLDAHEEVLVDRIVSRHLAEGGIAIYASGHRPQLTAGQIVAINLASFEVRG